VTLKYAKNAFAAELRTPLGELTTLPSPPTPLPTPLGACGASTLAPSVLASRRPPVLFDKSNTVQRWLVLDTTTLYKCKSTRVY